MSVPVSAKAILVLQAVTLVKLKFQCSEFREREPKATCDME